MKKRMTLTKDRPTKPITIRMPVDVIDDLKRIAPEKGMSGYQALIKFYVSKGLRADLEASQQAEKTAKLRAFLATLSLTEAQKREISTILPDTRKHP